MSLMLLQQRLYRLQTPSAVPRLLVLGVKTFFPSVPRSLATQWPCSVFSQAYWPGFCQSDKTPFISWKHPQTADISNLSSFDARVTVAWFWLGSLHPRWLPAQASRSHYQVVWVANEFVSNHVICVSHNVWWNTPQFPPPLVPKQEPNQALISTWDFFPSAIHIFCGWFGSLFQGNQIGILIGTVWKQLSDENHLDFIFIIYLFLL